MGADGAQKTDVRMKKQSWLKENIKEVLAIVIVLFTMYFYRLVLLKEVKADEVIQTAIVASVTSIIMFVLGFYFGATHSEKPTELKTLTDANSKPE